LSIPTGPCAIWKTLADPRAFGQLHAQFFKDLMDAPDPDMALNNFDRLVHAVFGRSAFFRQLESRPEMSQLLLLVLGGSQFMADILVRDPESLYWLTETP
jgi:[glutamine synthetase] adenylyltransferase / [glutamine synthetase]-adenylyl-L-tyrosine phosphorylase